MAEAVVWGISAIFSLIALIAHLLSLLFFVRYGKKRFSPNIFTIVILLILFSLFHTLSNFLEWANITSAFDQTEDYTEILEVVTWILFVYSFIQSQEEKQIHCQHQELLKLARFESVGNLAGNIAHDFRNFLTAILGNLGLMKDILNNDSEMMEYLDDIEAAALKAKIVSDSLLSLAKDPGIIKTSLDLPQVLLKTVDFTLKSTQTTLKYLFEDPHLNILGDQIQLSQVFQNLALNASQAMNHVGELNLRTLSRQLEKDDIYGLSPGHYIQIDFIDRGRGIPESDLEKIFEPYFTTRMEGTGLGLSISLSIIRNHGGTIQVHSIPGRHTWFSVYLPI